MSSPRFAKEHLKAFVERIEKLNEERKAISDDVRDVYAEAKANGYDVKALKVVIRLRELDPEERKEHEAIVDTYLHALGMIAGTAVATRAGAREETLPDGSPSLAKTAPPPERSKVAYIADRAERTAKERAAKEPPR